MTSAQRRKRNRENGARSRGPVTQAGKDASRCSSLKHGLTAKVLTLPGEDPVAIQAAAERFHEDLQPQGRDEKVLVDHIGLASLRIERIEKAHHANIAEQVESAEVQWYLKQQLRLVKFRRLLRSDRSIAILKLRSFGAGVSWLLGRWKYLESAFNASQCWTDLALIREALLLRGFRDDTLDSRTGSGFEVAHLALSCIEDAHKNPELVHFLANYDDEGIRSIAGTKNMKTFLDSMASYIPDEFLSRRDVRVLAPSEARRTMRTWIERQIAELRELDRHFREVDARSKAGAKVRAMAPADTPRNRLLLRYMKSAEMLFDRSRKTLAKLQKERQKRAENEAEMEAEEAPKTEFRNEPSVVPREPSKELVPGSYVRMDGKDYVVVEKSDGNVILCLVEPTVEVQPREVAATSENSV